MSSRHLARATGRLSHRAFEQAETSDLLHSVQAAPGVLFDGGDGAFGSVASVLHEDATVWAHKAGVNCLAIDHLEGRYLLSGGSDASIKLWDLESTYSTSNRYIYKPESKVDRASSSHKFGITHLSFYPFDSLAFLSSSFDHTLKIHATDTLQLSASFDLNSVVYSHALSPIADHLLVACACQHPAVRLVDLRSGANAHSLAGHQGAVLSVAWSPKDEYVLASGGTDGTARVWDIRRSAASLGVLDLEDSIGIGGEDGLGVNGRHRNQGTAHIGPCNGIVWRDDGAVLVTAGHDERVRVWDAVSGANALSHFGPIIKNKNLSPLLPLLVPESVGIAGQSIMMYPNEKEILVFDLFEGTLLKRLRIPGSIITQTKGVAGQRNTRNKATSLAWRTDYVEFYSAHSDGTIRAWKPWSTSSRSSSASADDSEDNERKRKRQTLDNMFRDLTRQKITFT